MFILTAYDKNNALDIRLKNREAHIAWLKSLGDKLKLAGPMLDDKGQMIGSMLILDFEAKRQAEEVLQQDPYHQAGLFRKTKLVSYKVVINQL